MIGVISYLPDNESLREIRRLNVIKVIDELRSLFPSEPITVVAQNYHDDEYLDNINYIKFDKGIGVPNARNVILKMFYHTDDDYLYMTDDDILMYDYYDAQQFIRDLYYGRYNEYNIDFVTSLTPDFSPFKELVYKHDYVHNHILKRATVTSGNPCIIIRNYNKFYNKQIYYGTDHWVNNGMTEDVEFIGNIIYQGLTAYVCVNWIKKLLNKDDSVVFTGLINERKDRLNFTKKTIETLCNRYNSNSIREFNNLYNKTPKLLYVKRPEPYTITENLIPKSYKKITKLF